MSRWTRYSHPVSPTRIAVCRHACDSPQCCKPAHLPLGTIKGNYDDTRARGRRRSGQKGGAPLPTNEHMGEIVQSFREGRNNQQIARCFPCRSQLHEHVGLFRAHRRSAGHRLEGGIAWRTPYDAVYAFDWLSTTGNAIMLAAVVMIAFLRKKLADAARTLRDVEKPAGSDLFDRHGPRLRIPCQSFGTVGGPGAGIGAKGCRANSCARRCTGWQHSGGSPIARAPRRS